MFVIPANAGIHGHPPLLTAFQRWFTASMDPGVRRDDGGRSQPAIARA